MKTRIALAFLLAIPAYAYSANTTLDDAGDPTVTTETVTDHRDDLTLFDDMDFQEVSDPLETINRGIFWFNDKVYFYALKPVAKVYRHVPEGMRVSVKNFFLNLQTPVRMVNAGLQGKLAASGTELSRFLINTTLGIGGFFDPAREHFDLKLHDEDTGQTLGYYGIGPGPYLVLPLLGPSNLRDAVGTVADTTLDLSYVAWGKDKGSDNYDYLGARTLNTINDVSLDKDTYESMKRDALDPYLFVRDAHEQYRKNLVQH